jgi:hypothetical protein
MTATTIARRHRPWVPVLNMLVALAALVIAVLALADAPDAVRSESIRTPSPRVVVEDGPANASPLDRMTIDGCDRARGMNLC